MNKTLRKTRLDIKKDYYYDLEKISKLFLSISAIAYIVGLIIVNLHYNQYGFYSLSLFRINSEQLTSTDFKMTPFCS